MKEDIKYPAILKSTCGSQTVVVYKDGSAYHIEGDFKGEYSKAYNTDDTRNASKEVLANTYGKVESKEHAEFIVELAKVNGIPGAKHGKGEFFNFFTDYSGDIRLGFFNERKAKCEGEKLITIPMPPKEVEVVDEWPRVGSKVTWGEREIIGTVKCIDNGWAWILCPDGKYTQQGVKYLKPPKTEEEKLRDEVKAVINAAMKHPLGFLSSADDELTDYMFKNFNITKKPQ